jgi:hypothetical protein
VFTSVTPDEVVQPRLAPDDVDAAAEAAESREVGDLPRAVRVVREHQG